MVSFFGLRFKGDKKRSQKKEPAQKWDTADRQDFSQGQYHGNNLARPSTAVPASLRPGTSCSARPTQAWAGVYDDLGVTNSMADLAPPVMGLRHNASEANLRSLIASRDPRPSLTLPAGMGGVGGAAGIDARSASAMNLGASNSQTSARENPLQIHHATDVPNVRPGTVMSTRAASAAKNPLARSETEGDVLVDALSAKKFKGSEMGRTGYPSPPQSDGNSDRCYSPYHPSIGRVTPESAAPSPTAISHDQTRPDMARQDTSTGSYRQTRRRSLTREHSNSESMSKKQPAEGFVGNFADFDFGVGPSRPSRAWETTRNDSVSSAPAISQSQTVGVALGLSTVSLPPTAKSQPSTPTSPRNRSGLVLTSDSPLSAVGTDREALRDMLPQCFPSRVDSIARSMRAPIPAPIMTRRLSIPEEEGPKASPVSNLQSPSSSLQSPFGPPSEGIGHYLRKPLPPSPTKVSRKSSIGNTSAQSKSTLPRGRITEPSQLSASSTMSSFADAEDNDFDGDRLTEDEDDDGDIGPILDAWPDFNTNEHRHSAVPPPLTPSGRSPTETSVSFCPSPAPRIPSPTFPSLLSSTSFDLGSSFELALAETLAASGACSPKRVEAPRAPPRPEAPVTLPPSTSFSERQRERGVSISPRRPPPQAVRVGFI
ncbi:hypothetical protein HIM_05382 [Hirsutella minnesotensis 3608]|uniref:Uncharacterized protein n=1 Tax=Hirsutella minnesotensis 3608 TaxID=1043627 RepID=A0A0F7ZUN8_9HYPO|nr:hypothetical protein HIM_05382 [Hirsutella minnesotensis 3608]